GFPRHIGTHSSGIVISHLPLATIAPIQPSARGITQIWELDKDDAETIGAIKFDVLSLRMLSAIQDSERDIRDGEMGRWGDGEMDAGTRRWGDAGRETIAHRPLMPQAPPGLGAGGQNPKSKIENPKFSYDRIPFGDP